MESKPKVFVSSTIYDFADLRSALKYWLNEMGCGYFAEWCIQPVKIEKREDTSRFVFIKLKV